MVLASENSKVRDTWLFTGKELICCLLQELVKVKAVGGMTCFVDCLHPKPV
jgi:hypothetical protein